jgi:uncharacterized protein (DUF1499 family)
MVMFVRVGMLLLTVCWLGCGGRMPDGLGDDQGMLASCPNKPNCVSSFASDEDHHIAALGIEGSPKAAWAGLWTTLEDTPRVEIVSSSDYYIHAVYTSLVMGYRDDVEFLLLPSENEIAVRSASRMGYGDMGVNRKRIEAIREALSAQGLVRSSPADRISGPAK